jgi:serine/threonine protein kinase
MGPIFPGAIIKHGPNTYEIGSEITSGGFGVVYNARRRTPPQEDVVVKVPAPGVLETDDDRARFEREASILANIQHRNVVHIVAFWKFVTGEMALVQELVPNALTLTQYIPTHTAEAPSVLLQALYAMRAFHGGTPGAVHRDLSPRNVLVDANGTVKVIDFGLAKENPRGGASLTRTGWWMGTTGCIAPEQMSDAKRVDHRADLYAIGRSMTAALQGREPMHAEPSALPPPWRTVIERLCAYEPENRPATADEAINEAMEAFSGANLTLTNFDVHVAEAETVATTPRGWAKACRDYFETLSDFDYPHLVLASRLDAVSFAPPFDAAAFFDAVEAGSALQGFNLGQMGYDDCDPLGSLYVKLYKHLDPARRLKCFGRLCKTAIHWHRFKVMGDVREIFRIEKDRSLVGLLLVALSEEDPGGTIQRRGVIPEPW